MHSQILPLSLLGAPLVSAYGLIVSATGDLGGQGPSSLPQISTSSGVLNMVYHQINRDGAGPIACSVSADASGNLYKTMIITTNVPGINGKSNAENVDFPLVASMPASTKCTGIVGSITNACVVKCQNPVDPFGSSFIVQQKVPSADSTIPSLPQQPLELRARAHKGAAKKGAAKKGGATAATTAANSTTAATAATVAAVNGTTTTTTAAKKGKAKAAKGKAAKTAAKAKVARDIEGLLESVDSIVQDFTDQGAKKGQAAVATQASNATTTAVGKNGAAKASKAAGKGATAKKGGANANAGGAAANGTAVATTAAATNGTAATTAKKGKAGKAAKTAAKAAGSAKANKAEKAGRGMRRGTRLQY